MSIFDNNKTEKIVFISKPAEYNGMNSCFSLPTDIGKSIDRNSTYMITVEKISNISQTKRKISIVL